MTAPTYAIAKELNSIISKYLPAKYLLKSTDEFLDVLRSTQPNGLLASLDVESLFTNVPVEDTINIICDYVYNSDVRPPPKLPKSMLKNLLGICTMEAPFRHIDGSLYQQIDGIAMGSPLGPAFAYFYMCHLENKVLQNEELKPPIYCRYVDDIFVVVPNEDALIRLKQEMELNSKLRFTYEMGVDNKIPFLDIYVDGNGGRFKTSLFKKPTDLGLCLHAKSECPEKYKRGVIQAFLHRAYKASDDWNSFHSEMNRLKQILINNGYRNSAFDSQLNEFLQNKIKSDVKEAKSVTHIVYYRNQMSSSYREDERILKSIVKSNIKCVNEDEELKLLIYYKNRKTKDFLMTNNINRESSSLQRSNIVYKFSCPVGGCKLQNNVAYIGSTRTTLSRRLTMHLQEGSIKKHYEECHNKQLDRQSLVENTSIVASASDFERLFVKEALLIREESPDINHQETGIKRILHLYGSI